MKKNKSKCTGLNESYKSFTEVTRQLYSLKKTSPINSIARGNFKCMRNMLFECSYF